MEPTNKEIAKALFDQYPDKNECMVASDGTPFSAEHKNHAETYASANNLTLETFTRTSTASKVNEADTKKTEEAAAKKVADEEAAKKKADDLAAKKLVDDEVVNKKAADKKAK